MLDNGEVTPWQAAVARMHRKQPPRGLPPEPCPCAVRVDLDTHREMLSEEDSSSDEFQRRTKVVVVPFAASGGNQRNLYMHYLLGGLPESFTQEHIPGTGDISSSNCGSAESCDSEEDRSKEHPEQRRTARACRYISSMAGRASPHDSSVSSGEEETVCSEDDVFIKGSDSESSVSSGQPPWMCFNASGESDDECQTSTCSELAQDALVGMVPTDPWSTCAGDRRECMGDSDVDSVHTDGPSRARTPATDDYLSECEAASTESFMSAP